jgi:hypothetical protein
MAFAVFFAFHHGVGVRFEVHEADNAGYEVVVVGVKGGRHLAVKYLAQSLYFNLR